MAGLLSALKEARSLVTEKWASWSSNPDRAAGACVKPSLTSRPSCTCCRENASGELSFRSLRHCHCQSLSSCGRRLAAGKQLAVSYPPPKPSPPHFKHRKSRHPCHLPVLWGRTESGFQRHIQRQRHGTADATCGPALVELLKSEKEMEKKQFRCVPGSQSASCSLGGLHGAFHSRTQRVIWLMSQASRCSQKLHRTPTLLLLQLGASLA